MIIKSIMTDEDRKALEYMLSLEYAMPYQLLKTKNNRRKIIYIMTPVLFLLSIGCYFVNYKWANIEFCTNLSHKLKSFFEWGAAFY